MSNASVDFLKNLENDDLISRAKKLGANPHRVDGPAVDFLRTIRNVVQEIAEDDFEDRDRRVHEGVESTEHLIYTNLARSTFTDLNLTIHGEVNFESYTSFAEDMVYRFGTDLANELSLDAILEDPLIDS